MIPILSLPLPAGSYVAASKLSLGYGSGSALTCQIESQSTKAVLDQTTLSADYNTVLVNTATITLSTSDTILAAETQELVKVASAIAQQQKSE